MLKRSAFAALLLLALGAGCAVDTASLERGLDDDNESLPDGPRCARTSGDYTGPDGQPPTVSIPLGEDLLDPAEVFQQPRDPRAALLAEYATATLNLDADIEVTAEDVDLLVLVEDRLAQPGIISTDLVEEVRRLNRRWATELPCVLAGTNTAEYVEPYMNPVDEEEPLPNAEQRSFGWPAAVAEK